MGLCHLAFPAAVTRVLCLHIQYLELSLLQTLAIGMGVWRHLTVVLVCSCLMSEDLEHLFMCCFAICVSSLVRCLVIFHYVVLFSLCLLFFQLHEDTVGT